MIFDPIAQEKLEQLLIWRRDVRHFRTDPIAPELIDILRASMDRAPSVGNARPWRVLEVTSKATRAKVAAEFQEANGLSAAIYSDEKRAQYERLKLAGIDNAPLQLAVFTDIAPQEGHGLGRQFFPETLAQSTSMAIFCLWLTARAHNLGLGMVSILRPNRMETLFDVPDNWKFSAYLCIGYPEHVDDTPLLHRNDWQHNTPTQWRKI